MCVRIALNMQPSTEQTVKCVRTYLNQCTGYMFLFGAPNYRTAHNQPRDAARLLWTQKVCVKFMRWKVQCQGSSHTHTHTHEQVHRHTHSPMLRCALASKFEVRSAQRWFRDLRYQLAGNERKYVYNIHTCSNSSQWVRPWCKISFACISTWLNTSYAE